MSDIRDMKNGSQPLKLLQRARRSGKRVVSRADLVSWASEHSHPDRAISRLAREGQIEKLDRGVWLVPSRERPAFETPRFWSNPDLTDALTISALVVKNPTMRDVVRLILAYGSAPAEKALAELEAAQDIPSSVAQTSRRMIDNTKRGLAQHADRRAQV